MVHMHVLLQYSLTVKLKYWAGSICFLHIWYPGEGNTFTFCFTATSQDFIKSWTIKYCLEKDCSGKEVLDVLVFGLPRDLCVPSNQSNTSLSVRAAGSISLLQTNRKCHQLFVPRGNSLKTASCLRDTPKIYNKHWISDESSKHPQWWPGQPNSTKSMSIEKVTLSSWAEQGGAPREVQRPLLRAWTALFQTLWSSHTATKVRLLFPRLFTEAASQHCSL